MAGEGGGCWHGEGCQLQGKAHPHVACLQAGIRQVLYERRASHILREGRGRGKLLGGWAMWPRHLTPASSQRLTWLQLSARTRTEPCFRPAIHPAIPNKGQTRVRPLRQQDAMRWTAKAREAKAGRRTRRAAANSATTA